MKVLKVRVGGTGAVLKVLKVLKVRVGAKGAGAGGTSCTVITRRTSTRRTHTHLSTLGTDKNSSDRSGFVVCA